MHSHQGAVGAGMPVCVLYLYLQHLTLRAGVNVTPACPSEALTEGRLSPASPGLSIHCCACATTGPSGTHGRLWHRFPAGAAQSGASSCHGFTTGPTFPSCSQPVQQLWPWGSPLCTRCHLPPVPGTCLWLPAPSAAGAQALRRRRPRCSL